MWPDEGVHFHEQMFLYAMLELENYTVKITNDGCVFLRNLEEFVAFSWQKNLDCLAINYQKHAKIPTEETKKERNLQPTESYNLLHSNTLQLQKTYPKRDEIFMVNSK